MPAQFPPQPPKLTAEMIARAVARLAIEAQAAKASTPLNYAPRLLPLRPTKVDMVWDKGRIDPSADATGRELRRDCYGFLIARSEYGNRNSGRGWEIDHIKPVAAGGPDELHNLQPLYWDANCIKSDN